MATSTNIDELENFLRLWYSQIIGSQLFRTTYAEERIGEAMREGVVEQIASSRYDFNQSGELLKDITDRQVPDASNNSTSTGTMINIGLFELKTMNKVRRPMQFALFNIHGNNRYVRLHAERDLPQWIIAEFGRRAGVGDGASPDGIPSDFIVPYTSRDPQNNHLIGPSISRHSKKSVFFFGHAGNDLADEDVNHVEGLHRGIEPEHIFSLGLKRAQPKIFEIAGEGIYESMKQFANTYGGEVEME